MRDARAPQGIDSTGVPPVAVPPQEQCDRGQAVGEASHIKKQATPHNDQWILYMIIRFLHFF